MAKASKSFRICVECQGSNRVEARFCRRCGSPIPPRVPEVTGTGFSEIDWEGTVGLSEFRETMGGEILGIKAFYEREKRWPALHMLLLGAPGTGKTMLGKLLARILHAQGITTQPDALTVSGINFPETPEDVAALFRRAKGKLLFIDDVHKVLHPDGMRYGRVRIFDYLVSEMEEEANRFDPFILVAGQPTPVLDYLESHRDVKQRFNRTIRLPEPSLSDLVEMAIRNFSEANVVVPKETEARLKARFRYIRRDANAQQQHGHIPKVEVQEIIKDHARRMGPLREGTGPTVLMPEDIVGEIHKEQTMEEVMAGLDDLVGMEGVRSFIQDTVALAKRKERDAQNSGTSFVFDQHIRLTGNPGTGKTTIARRLGAVFAAAGLLPTDRVLEVAGRDLVAVHVGETASRVNELCDKAIGGILFIDEVYALGNQGYDQEAIDTLTKRIEDDRGRYVVIIAGYKDKTDVFLTRNEGLKSRFDLELHLRDYTADEMLAIFLRLAAQEKLVVTPPAQDHLRALFQSKLDSKDPAFGNARFVRSHFKQSEKARATRLRNTDSDEMVLQKEDVTGEPQGRDYEADFRKAMKELEAMVGLAKVKEALHGLGRQMWMDRKRGVSMAGTKTGYHLVFLGNSGTGKTTVARMIGRIFKALGVLSQGHVVEVTRRNLIAGYVGQTAKAVDDRVKEALDGVLFIDEAYQLLGGENDFGGEAISELLVHLEDRANRLVVIMAGYPEPMAELLKSNSGLAGRFSHYLTFEDYTPEERTEILMKMVQGAHNPFQCEEGFEPAILEYFTRRGTEGEGPYANGRGVSKLFEEIKRRQAHRIYELVEEGEENQEELFLLRVQDIPEVVNGAR